ncbi:DMT family transporter [Acidiferrobacter sp.]|uniref:DMT family transporter n=1 Tax=Acidiferrobacter sp. TaxID=1872107 RepID=UPI00260F6095|nr:DMT family transporter [Acidiferrobacter sp.]
MTKKAYPVVAIVLGAGAWGMIWYPLRIVAAGGLSGVWLAVVMYAGAAAAGLVLCRGGACAGVSGRVWLALAVLGGVTNIGFVVAVLHDNVLRVTLLFYLSPVWSVLGARVFLGERLPAAAGAGIAIALIGVGMLLWRPSSPALTVFDALALVSGAAFAGANVVLRAQPSVPLAAKLLATFLGVVGVGLAALLVSAHGLPHPRAGIVLAALIAGGLGILAITLLVQYGVTALPVRQSSVLLLAEVVTAAFSQHLLLHGVLTARTLAGALAVASGATLVAVCEA